MSLPEAAKILGVSPKTVRYYVKMGKIPAAKWGRVWRISPETVRKVANGEISLNGDSKPGT